MDRTRTARSGELRSAARASNVLLSVPEHVQALEVDGVFQAVGGMLQREVADLEEDTPARVPVKPPTGALTVAGAPRTFWTVAAVDDALAAHFERTIAITANGPEIPTQV